MTDGPRPDMPPNGPPEIITRALLNKAGIGTAFSLDPLEGGNNNRVFRVRTPSRAYLLKLYYMDPTDSRDRLDTEFSFLSFLWNAGVRSVPQPVARAAEHAAGLYAYVDGSPVGGEIARGDHVTQALDFIDQVIAATRGGTARGLAKASEACFSIQMHIDCVDRRLERLCRIAGESDVDRSAGHFVRNALTDTWHDVRDGVLRQAASQEMPLETPIQGEDRCLSPSDFGFHNAIERPSGEICFIDFEYAGWDDPAKMACDFLCQPAVPVPETQYSRILSRICRHFPSPSAVLARCNLLLPVHRLKWCALLLNDFLPTGDQRRLFATGIGGHSRRQRQLQKSKTYFNRFFGESPV